MNAKFGKDIATLIRNTCMKSKKAKQPKFNMVDAAITFDEVFLFAYHSTD